MFSWLITEDKHGVNKTIGNIQDFALIMEEQRWCWQDQVQIQDFVSDNGVFSMAEDALNYFTAISWYDNDIFLISEVVKHFGRDTMLMSSQSGPEDV